MIETLAIEIAGSLPQLAGYIEQVENRRVAEGILPVRATSKICAGTTGYAAHDPSTSRKGDEAPSLRPGRTSIFYAECNDEIKTDAPSHIHPPVRGPQPSSVYHMLFQMYSLRPIHSLPRAFQDWIQDRIVWMESISDEEDLVRLQDMMQKRPGDGFLENEG
jgi:hypothetical protein